MSTQKIVAFIFVVAMLRSCSAAQHFDEDRDDPELLQYLDDVFQRVKLLKRPLVNNEMNLLPQGKEGFANTIRCFFDGSTPSTESNSRILKFNLSSLSITDRVTAMQLVLKHDSSPIPYRVKLYEFIGEKVVKTVKLLDSGEYHGLWHTLDIQNVQDSKDKVNGIRNYQLALALATKSGRRLRMEKRLKKIKPMLLVYTNDLNWMGLHSGDRSEETKPQAKRRLSRKQPKMERGKRSTSEQATLQQKAEGPCSRHVAPASADFASLFLGDFNQLLFPATLEFSFCHGTCKNPTNPETADLYNNHAKFMALTSLASPELGLKGVSPCCVPNEVDIIEVKTKSTLDFVYNVISYPVVKSCRCQ